MYRYLICLFCFLSLRATAQTTTPHIIHLPELEHLLSSPNDTTYVINFWATWCKPCVAELPHFEKLTHTYANRKFKVLLISLDAKKDMNTKLMPFLDKNKIISQVLLLDEVDFNSWINKIDTRWSGAIPATLVLNHAHKIRNFYEKEFTFDELSQTVAPFVF